MKKILSSVLLLSLSACGGSQGSADTQDPSNLGAASASEEGTTAEAPKGPPPQELTFVNEDFPVMRHLALDISKMDVSNIPMSGVLIKKFVNISMRHFL